MMALAAALILAALYLGAAILVGKYLAGLDRREERKPDDEQ